MAAITDGTFSTAKQDGPRKPSYPFATSFPADLYAIIYDRPMVVYPVASFAPGGVTRTSVTNLLTYSEQFDNAAWTKADATIAANSIANPMDGLVTGDTLAEAATTAEHLVSQAGTLAASAATFSVCVQAKGRDWVRLKITDSAATVKVAFFNVTTGALGTVSSGATSAMTQVYSGWYRCALTFTSPASGSATCLIEPSTDGSTVSYAGDITKGLYIFGAQLEQGSAAGAYAVTTNATRTISAPNIEINEVMDGTDPFAYLCVENEVTPANGVGFFPRRYARIPASQTSYPGSRYFPLPNVTNDFDGLSALPAYTYPLNSNVGNGFYNSAASAIYTDYQQALYGATKALSLKVIGVASGGTFTLTYGANTTGALNWNDSGATIATAINGLASVIAAGLTATVSNGLATATGGTLTITWTAGSTLTALTMNSSLTLTTADHPTTQIVSSASQVIRMTDQYTATGHGLSTGLALATVRANDTLLIITTANWGSVDSNTLWLPTTGSVGDYAFVGTYKRVYVPGRVYLLRTKLVEDFFLPGVTTGITTPGDITVDIGLQNPADFINGLLTLSSWQIYDTDGPAAWLGGPQYRRAYTSIQLDDIL